MSPGSLMPRFPWLITDQLDISSTAAKIRAMQSLGVPYPAGFADQSVDSLTAQASRIAAGLKQAGVDVSADREIIALIAYLQRLGIDIRATQPVK